MDRLTTLPDEILIDIVEVVRNVQGMYFSFKMSHRDWDIPDVFVMPTEFDGLDDGSQRYIAFVVELSTCTYDMKTADGCLKR